MEFEELIGFVVCFGIFMVSILLPVWLGLMTRQANALQQIATRYGGKTTTEHAFARSKLRFVYGQTIVQIRYVRRMPSGGGRQTEIRVNVPYKNAKIEAIHRMGNSRFWWGEDPEWESGDERFDQTYSCRTDHKTTIEEILTPAIRWQMLQLCSIGVSGLYLSIHNGEMVISTPRFLTRQQMLDDFVRLSLELYDQLMLARAVGIDFVQDQTAIIDEVKCPICTCDIEGTMVVCLRCKTPHCLECWKYNGKCATFACGETRYIYPVASSED